jgi:uncharacterized membrane protein
VHDLWPYAVVFALAVLTYLMRVGGYLLANVMGISPTADRLLRLAPGNLFVAVVTAAAAKGGVPIIAGSIGTMLMMKLTRREWLALAAALAEFVR